MATTSLFFVELNHLRHRWGWLLALGMLMIALGILALFAMPVATVAAVLALGWVMVVSGIIEVVHAFGVHRWGGAFLHLVAGIVGILLGLLVVTHPVAGALAWTLIFSAFFTIIGIFRIVAALRFKFLNWGWTVFDGAITLVLGILIGAAWPWSGFWFLGLSVGISLLLRGWSYVMMAIALRALPSQGQTLRAA